MRILLTNDDGLQSAGLTALARELLAVAELVVVAPERQQSAAGHAITLHKPLRMEPAAIGDLDIEAYATNGTPADCVILGVLATSKPPDMVISGINAGANLGEEVLYSGTVSAALEAALQDLPAFAVSVTEYHNPQFAAAAQFARRLVENWQYVDLRRRAILNVNVPSVTPDRIKGVAVTRLGRRAYVNEVSRRKDPRGQPYYWFSGEPRELDSEEGTDISVVAAGCISITPIHFDLTDHESIGRLQPLVARLGG